MIVCFQPEDFGNSISGDITVSVDEKKLHT